MPLNLGKETMHFCAAYGLSKLKKAEKLDWIYMYKNSLSRVHNNCVTYMYSVTYCKAKENFTA